MEVLLVQLLIHCNSVFQSEELLTDVLYSVQSLMGATGGGVWLLSGTGMSHTQPNSCVNIDQVKQALQAAFQVTPESMNRINKEVQSRPVSSEPVGKP